VRARKPAEYFVAAEVILYLCLSQFALLLPSNLLLTRLTAASMRQSRGSRTDLARAKRLDATVAAICRRWPIELLCLQRSIVLGWLLRRRGLEGSLAIGVKRVSESLLAHAWIEVSGIPVGDSTEHCSQFARLHAALELSALNRAEFAL
jgi:hypothetical protein